MYLERKKVYGTNVFMINIIKVLYYVFLCCG